MSQVQFNFRLLGDEIHREAVVGHPLELSRRFKFLAVPDASNLLLEAADIWRRLQNEHRGGLRWTGDDLRLHGLARRLIPDFIAKHLPQCSSISFRCDRRLAILPFELLRVNGGDVLCKLVPVARLPESAPGEPKLLNRGHQVVLLIDQDVPHEPITGAVASLGRVGLHLGSKYPGMIGNADDVCKALRRADIPVIVAHRPGSIAGSFKDSVLFVSADDIKAAWASAPSVPRLLIALTCGDGDIASEYFADVAESAAGVGIPNAITAAVQISPEHASHFVSHLLSHLGNGLTIGGAVHRARVETAARGDAASILAMSVMLHGSPDAPFIVGNRPYDAGDAVIACEATVDGADGTHRTCGRAVPISNPLAVKRRCEEHAPAVDAAAAWEIESVTEGRMLCRDGVAGTLTVGERTFAMEVSRDAHRDLGGRRWKLRAEVRVDNDHRVVEAFGASGWDPSFVTCQAAARTIIDRVLVQLNPLIDEFEADPAGLDNADLPPDRWEAKIAEHADVLGLRIVLAPKISSASAAGAGNAPAANVSTTAPFTRWLEGYLATAPNYVRGFLDLARTRALERTLSLQPEAPGRQLARGSAFSFGVQLTRGAYANLTLLYFAPDHGCTCLAPLDEIPCSLSNAWKRYPGNWSVELLGKRPTVPRDGATAQQPTAVIVALATRFPLPTRWDAVLQSQWIQQIQAALDGESAWAAAVETFEVV